MVDFHQLSFYNKQDDSLRPYQRDIKKQIYSAWEHYNSIMLQMPTGTGKTRVFTSIMKDVFHYSRENNKAYKILVLVHRKELVEQIAYTLGYEYNLAFGIIQSKSLELKRIPYQIASVQTLSRSLNRWTDKEFDFIIVDEAHHITAQSYQKIIKAFPNAKLLGVTATPCRLSGEGFMETFDKLIVSPSVKKFIADGYLSSYEYYSVSKHSYIQREIDQIKKFANGDYAEDELERICDNAKIRAQIIETYLKYAKGKKGIVYTINKLHNSRLAQAFCDEGFNAVAIDSDTSPEKRSQYIEDFRAGNIDIICNVNLFTEGFDCPDIEFVQLARPTQSLSLYLQQVGRGLRVSENKNKTIFLDNVGLYNKFGFPSADVDWQFYFLGESKDKKGKIGERATGITREANQDLSEGREKVYLIEFADEESYINSRIELFKNIVNEFIELDNEAVDKYLRPNSDKDYITLGSSSDSIYFGTFYEYIIENLTKTIEDEITAIEYWDLKLDKLDHYKSIDDYLTCNYNGHNYYRLSYLKRKGANITNKIKDSHFTKEELGMCIEKIKDDIVSAKPKLYKGLNYSLYDRLFWISAYCSSLKKTEEFSMKLIFTLYNSLIESSLPSDKSIALELKERHPAMRVHFRKYTKPFSEKLKGPLLYLANEKAPLSDEIIEKLSNLIVDIIEDIGKSISDNNVPKYYFEIILQICGILLVKCKDDNGRNSLPYACKTILDFNILE